MQPGFAVPIDQSADAAPATRRRGFWRPLALAGAWALALVLLPGLPAAHAAAAEPAVAPPVVGWVPAYAVDKSMSALQSNPAIAKGLSRIGLQFWNPSADGRTIVLAPRDESGTPVTEADIERVRDWAHAHGIKVLLTVYNNSETTKVWDWDWALRAFAEHRDDFVQALVQTMQRHDLDGIDIDLEGNGLLDSDRAAFADFIRVLSRAVRAHGKLLTVDTFHSPCYNAPNMSWWPDWVGQIDTLHVMGYADLYEASEETFQKPGMPVCENGAYIFKYSWQLAYALRAGYQPGQVAMGMPAWTDHWGRKGAETSAASHLAEVQALGAGVALWDLQLPAAGWRSDATWQAVQALRTHPGSGWKALPDSPVAGRPKP